MKKILIIAVVGLAALPSYGAVLSGRGSSESAACRAAKTNGNMAFHEVKPIGPCNCRKDPPGKAPKGAEWTCSVKVEYVKADKPAKGNDKKPGKTMDIK